MPSRHGRAFWKTYLHHGQHQSEDHKSDGDPLRPLSQLRVGGLGLVFAHEGFGSAGDRAQAGMLTGLTQHEEDEQGSNNDLEDGNDRSSHNYSFPFK